ncbi:MAG TPA: mitofilin family membrane protein [Geminicoccaceae bacterium]|nr:mitofilin family membrane protein [Geminicoccaceae bacterium]
MIGAVIGGIAVTLALSYLWQPDSDGELPALRAQVDQLQAAVEGLQGAAVPLSELAGRIDALEQAAPPGIDAELQARLDGIEQTAPAVAELASRIDALETSVTAGAEPNDADERIQALQEELAALSANVAAQALGAGDATASDLALLETLQSRLAAVEADLPASKAAAEFPVRLDALAARVDALEPLAEQSTGVQDVLAGLSSQVEGLDEQIAGVRERIDALQAEGLDEQITGVRERTDALRAEVEGLSTRLGDTENRVAAARDRSEQAAALALLTSQIDHALAQSRGYEEPLRSLKALGDQDEAVRREVAELTPSAASGVPSLAQLQESFDPVAREVVQRARAPEGDSLIDQAASNLLRLVTVRPVGADVEGEEPAARVARAEAHLDAGDLAAAIAELETLEGPAAEPAADWLAQAKGRIATNAALERLRARTTELLTPTE